MEKTFAMIKPEAVSSKLSGKIIEIIELNGFIIEKMEKKHLSINEAKEFYKIHSERSFFGELVSYISSAPVIILVLKRENAVAAWRQLMGSTNPASAELGTIRRMFGKSIGENATHGSDSIENAKIEIDFFYKDLI